MEFFRAVPSSTDISKRNVRYNTRRLPSNIPYMVDNLWEYLRPANKPSRRHAVYASPSVELALQNASAFTNEADKGYVAYKLVFDHMPKFMQLKVSDARNHSDVRALQKMIVAELGGDFADLPVTAKLEMAPLFLPGISADELIQAAQNSAKLQSILTKAQNISTFWQGGDELDTASNGELFFELESNNSYVLSSL